ncbi:DUF2490 domain-containing protein [Chitinophagaceae bacterium LB-8]|uniref:DUF2490 domain-containing protein n=1 Tax=Paraflavisolibacter caeni TaxID=2982496 RepID=A0A9X3BHP7_9BACT|nr:DUF2490 domain-containing protein [Paraflavisolibacter caeni]MCU7552684.1 DUF2490 domain-containing protein [Paraflavisolibacter caeni]
MSKRLLFISAFILTVTITINAQEKQTQTVDQIWVGYFNQTRISNKWGIWFDGHLRTKDDFIDGFSQGIARFGLTYYLKDATKLTAGYAYVHHFPADNHKDVAQPEHRPWQQVQWHTKYAKIKTMQWFRLEERFRRKIQDDAHLAEGYNFNFRVRYNFLLQYPLSKKLYEPKTFSLVFNDEVHINFGDQIVYNYFDQNRLFVGFNYQVNKHDQLQFGYMNVYQQLVSGDQYKSINAARLFYFHNLDLRKKKQG